MNTKRIIKRKQDFAAGIIIICCLIFAGCFRFEVETITITIYRYSNGNVKETCQFSNIKSGAVNEEKLEEAYEELMSFLSPKEFTPDDITKRYVKIWINEDGFLNLLSQTEYAKKGSEEFIVKDDIIMTIFEGGASERKKIETNGEKIIKGDDLIIQWPINTSIMKLKMSETNPDAKDTVNKLAALFKKRNPKGVVEKHFE